MKRSEIVLNVIRPIIEKHLVNVGYPENVESYMAFDIIEAIEKAGMLPPCRADFGGHGNLSEDNSCKDYVESCDFTWEHEDEIINL